MIKIMLACSAGMSTSLLVTKMEAAAKESGIEAKIWAISEANIDKEVQDADVILLGPQVRFMLNKATEIAKPYNVPVEVINMMHYGTCNGKAVLDRAIELANLK
ncbi:PTS sugar transporter subunit IIB [Terrisporobacter mayombei]|uniref:Lichenan-specific phosphotransferase enzyme IIB component n=1 Tax=Terrisporobacter mayombei TaxID=1541 RepID=A0ABY9PZT6_9FIRM|nr:PTS sugar transporter subunit IIB [Terrisporobacter mayombei]MCC3869952.1 PTS sugar transporter subunit IIB [Terrisporobacter mayombei]WMT79842.1 Lichenan-specific phosphotransferase enzyme IIB component [Terrisporobacter mayombei]